MRGIVLKYLFWWCNIIETPRSIINDFELGSQKEASYRPPFQKDE